MTSKRKSESPATVTARGLIFRKRQKAEGRTRKEFYITETEMAAIKAILHRMRTNPNQKEQNA